MRQLCNRYPAVVCLLILANARGTQAAQPSREEGRGLVILTETGRERDGVPVLETYSGAPEISELLSRGFSGRWLRLYQYEQEYLRRATGSKPEPAYLLLSNRQGGFPRFGFYLGEQDKRQAGYVDLYKTRSLRKRFGGMDQIFPHELAHILMQQLAGEMKGGGSNQLHAIGVRTDPAQAFSEGFAEHCQVMALEDPDADPATRALSSDEERQRFAGELGKRYLHELEARWSPAGPMRMGFLFWFSGTEQVWRYYAVKQNAFARQTSLPERMFAARDLYPAYLALNVLPGTPQDPPKPASVMLATEGVVSTLFYRWATDEEMQRRYLDDDFYARFGTTRSGVTPLENIYLKLLRVFFVKKPEDTAAVIRGYKSMYPEESAMVDRVVQEVLLNQPLPDSPAIWLANPDFQTGTSLFDQYRCLPRTHTFDLNAATLVDLLSVSGMSRSLAEDVLKHAPYSSLDELLKVPGFTPEMMSRFRRMSDEMVRMTSDSAEDETGLSLGTILWSYGRRALILLAAASAAGALLYRRVRSVGWFRAAVNGLAASCVVLALAWLTTGTGAHIAFLGPLVLLALPATLWQLARSRKRSQAARVLAAWALAAVPALLLAYPWL